MYDPAHEPPPWVRRVLGRPVSRESAVFILIGGLAMTFLAAIVPIIAVIGSLLNGWSSTWTMSDTGIMFLVAALLAFDIWVWRAIHWMDRHAMWPPAHAHSPVAHG